MDKTCTRCGVEKSVEEFYRSKTKENIYISRCKKCIILLVKKYAEKNVEKINNIKRKYVERNKDKVKQSKLKWFDKNPNYKKEWAEKNNEKIKEKRKLNYLLNREEKIKYALEYSKKNRQKINDKIKNRRSNDILFKLKMNIRTRLKSFLRSKNITNRNKTFDIVGCSPEFLKEHLEKQFKEGMSWDNHGMFGWHIDHIIPLASAKTEKEIYKLSHYTNLQPLWAKENLQKNDKIIT